MNEASILLIYMLISEEVSEIAPKVVKLGSIYTRTYSIVPFLFSTQIVLKIDLTRFNLFNDKLLTL